ncbi:MAG: hypothetical protein WCG01_00975 [bacterium]
MNSFERVANRLTPEEVLRARNGLQALAMHDSDVSAAQWVADGNAEVAARIFDEKPDLLNSYFVFQNDEQKLQEILKNFEALLDNYKARGY